MSNSSLFEWVDTSDPRREWRGMPEFNQPDNTAYRQIIVSFDDQAGVDRFAELLGVHLTDKTKSLWYPPRDKNFVSDLFWFDKSGNNE